MARKQEVEEVEEEIVEEAPRKKKRRSSESEEGETAVHNPSYNEIMDELEKHYGLSAESMDPEARRSSVMSSGTLVTDLIMGGGIFPGGWYTIFGPEQSCKSTQTMTIVGSAAKQDMPAVSISDFEGCVVGESSVVEKHHGKISVEELHRRFLLGEELHIISSNGYTRVLDVVQKPIAQISTVNTESLSLSGFKHPFPVLTKDGDLLFKLMEDITEEDSVITSI